MSVPRRTWLNRWPVLAAVLPVTFRGPDQPGNPGSVRYVRLAGLAALLAGGLESEQDSVGQEIREEPEPDKSRQQKCRGELRHRPWNWTAPGDEVKKDRMVPTTHVRAAPERPRCAAGRWHARTPAPVTPDDLGIPRPDTGPSCSPGRTASRKPGASGSPCWTTRRSPTVPAWIMGSDRGGVLIRGHPRCQQP